MKGEVLIFLVVVNFSVSGDRVIAFRPIASVFFPGCRCSSFKAPLFMELKLAHTPSENSECTSILGTESLCLSGVF